MDTDQQTNKKQIAIWCITPNGFRLAKQLCAVFEKEHQKTSRILVSQKIMDFKAISTMDVVSFEHLGEQIQSLFNKFESHIFIFSTGIAVRMIKNLIISKTEDPAVVVVDDAGKFAVSLLSGHLGGANDLAKTVADIIDATPVVTTATDVNGLKAVDVIAQEKKLFIETPENIKHVNMAILKKAPVFLQDPLNLLSGELEQAYSAAGESGQASVFCSVETKPVSRGTLVLRPRILTLGIGCNRYTPSHEISTFIKKTMKEVGLSLHSVIKIGTSDVKIEEQGLLDTAKQMRLPIVFYTKQQLNSVKDIITPSKMAQKYLGINSVSEAAAILAADGGKLLITKKKNKDVTIAVAIKK